MRTKLSRYIREIRQITHEQAANEIGCSRVWLTTLCNGKPAGRRMARAVAGWSGGWLAEQDLMFPVDLDTGKNRAANV